MYQISGINVTVLRLIIYLRKSNESEDRQALSIPAQLRELRALAKRLGLKVIAVYEESMSAKRPGRPVFDKVMKMIQQGKADGVLVWHLDRLARNPKDGGDIMWMLGEKIMKAIVTPGQVFTGIPNDKLMMSIIFGMSTKYSDDLSLNVARGNREALERGRWIGKPKIGYLREHKTGDIVRDPERFDRVKELFTLRLQGVPVLDLVIRAKEWGLTTPRFKTVGGYPLHQSQVYRMLQDKFYAGVMVCKGVEYEGSHEAMITLKDFETIQSLNAGKAQDGPRSRKRTFTYQGLIRCGDCNALVTRDEKTNRYGYEYTYYHCCRKHRGDGCRQPSIEQDEIERQLAHFLSTLALPQDLVDFVLTRIPDEARLKQEARAEVAAQLEEQRRQNGQRLTRLRQLCIDGVIGADELAADRTKLFDEEQHLRDRLEILSGEEQLLEPLGPCISFVNQAENLFRLGRADEKRAIVQSVVSNLSLKDKTLLIEAKKPFSLFQQRERFPTGWALWEAITNLMVHEPDSILELARLAPQAVYSSPESTSTLRA